MALTKVGFTLIKDTVKNTISGSSTAQSSSFSSRVTTAETELENTLLSGSAQISTDISGSLGANASTIRTLSATTVSGSRDAASISGSFGNQRVGTTDNVLFNHITASSNISASSLNTRTILNSVDDLTLDSAGDVIIDADGADIKLKDDGTEFGRISRVSSDLVIKSISNNNDILFKGVDASSTITALTLDMSEAGNAIFNNDLSTGGNITGSNNVSASGNLSITGNVDVDGTSNFAGNVTLQNDLTVTGRIDAEEIHTTFISSSIAQATGSNIFGDATTDSHQFTGSVDVSGSLRVSDGDVTISDTLTATNIGAFTAAGAINFNNQAMTNVDINSGTINGITDLAITDGGTGASTAAGAAENLGLGITDNVVFSAISGSTGEFTSNITGSGDLGADGDLYVGGRITGSSGATFTDKVGIGTNAPGRLLDLVAPSDAVALNLRMRSADDFSFITFTDHDAGESFLGQIAVKRTGNGAGEMQFYTSGDNLRMMINNSGNVGIGISTPSSILEINSDTYPQFIINGTDNSGNIGFIFSGSAHRGGMNWNGGNNNVELLNEGGNVRLSLQDGTAPMIVSGALSVDNVNDQTAFFVDSNYRENARFHSTENNQGTRLWITNGSLPNDEGYGFVVGDGGNHRMTIGQTNSAGSFTTAPLNITGSVVSLGTPTTNPRVGQQLELTATGGSNRGGIAINTYLADTQAPLIDFNRSRNNTAGQHTGLSSGDGMGGIIFRGSDGDEFVDSVAILAEVDGSTGNNDVPGRLQFYTTPDGSNSLLERMRIKSTGVILTQSGSSQAGGISIKDGQIQYSSLGIHTGGTNTYTPSAANHENSAITIDFPNANDSAGLIRFRSHGSMEAFFGYAQDGSNGQGDFVFQGYNGSAYVELMRIIQEGHVGIGTTTPSYALDVEDSVNDWLVSIVNTASSGNAFCQQLQFTGVSPNNTTSKFQQFVDGGSTVRFEVRSNGGVASFQSNDADLSDESVKKDITDASNCLDTINNIKVRNFKYKDQTDDRTLIGVIAQEVEAVDSSLVDDSEDLKRVYNKDIMFMMLKSIQELTKRIEELENK